ncbi:hypothetical protein [Nonomuraea bangladeshensis]|uniref:hypothetical protein n=1 Tax=Nonomuraea bangladeshensis TaxID=404385 RepID=UPI003C30173F
MAYATSAEYAAYTGTTAPDGIDLLLARASRLVDQVLLCSVYDTGDEDVVTALREATIEQAAAWNATGIEDGTGAAAEWANVSIATVALGRPQSGGAGGGGSAAIRPAPQALMVLQQAGLTGHEPRTFPRCEAADG